MSVKLGAVVHNGRYEVLYEIERGTYGTVYRVKDTNAQKELVCKASDIHCKEKDTSALNEILILQQLRGIPSVPSLIDTFVTPNERCIVMDPELVDLETLWRKSEGDSLDKKAVIKIFFCMTEAIESIHSRGIIHRDLKLSNVMVSYDFHGRFPVRIIDFGLSVQTGRIYDVNAEDSLFLMCNYVSCHMANGMQASKRCDVEMILYCSMKILGKWPFDNRNSKKCLAAKEKFIRAPYEVLTKTGTYLLPMAIEIFNRPVTDTPNYKKLKSLLSSAIRNFDPIEYQLPIVISRRGTVTLE